MNRVLLSFIFFILFIRCSNVNPGIFFFSYLNAYFQYIPFFKNNIRSENSLDQVFLAKFSKYDYVTRILSYNLRRFRFLIAFFITHLVRHINISCKLSEIEANFEMRYHCKITHQLYWCLKTFQKTTLVGFFLIIHHARK